MTRFFLTAAVALAFAAAGRAAIVVPGANGSDGALNITANTVIDLSQAVTGPWDNDNTANAGKGVYDPAKWAVVFKYTEVNIAAGATVTFKNHASRAPVVWLVSGNAVIDGTLSLDGQSALPAPFLAEPGPGGFRGGSGDYLGVAPSAGFGPGGSGSGIWGWNGPEIYISSAGYGATAPDYGLSGRGFFTKGGETYGNPSLIPLVGGSGGGGNYLYQGSGSGGGGGGAILVAASAEIRISGSIHAAGGGSVLTGGGGSGGGIRLVASRLSGQGFVNAPGALAGRTGGVGRIRIERVLNDNTLNVTPDPSVVDLASGAVALLWPPNGAPEVRLVSIGSGSVPTDPQAEFGTVGADVALPVVNSVPIIVETKNVEQASQVKVRGTPRSNGNFTEVVATVDSIVSNDPLVIRWKADLPVSVGYSAVQAHVIRP